MMRARFVPTRPSQRGFRLPRGCSRALAAAALCCAAIAGVGNARADLSTPPATDLGAPTRAAVVTTTFNLNSYTVTWLSFTIPEASPSSGLFLDIDTAGSLLTTNDTEIGLYDSLGNRIAVNDDYGAGALSALSFGLDSPARSGLGPMIGQNGSLPAGTYYLAVCGYNPATSFGLTGFAVNNGSFYNGFAQVHVRLGPPAPVASAGPDQTVPENTSVVIDASASRGVDACSVTLAWSQIAGPVVALDATDQFHPTFTAPEVGAGGGTLTFQVDASSCEGPIVSDFVNITVTNVNRAPVAEAGPDQTVAENSAVVLDGSHSYDLDDDALTFFWSQVSGPAVTLSSDSSPAPTFFAPSVGAAGAVVRFGLAVSDGIETTVDFVDITVENVNHPPVASAGPGGSFDENTLVTLNASASSDPDNDALSFSWQQIGGPSVTLSGAATATPSFTAPNVCFAGITLTFRVTVSDGIASSTADVSVFIRQSFSPPNCAHARPSDDSLWPPNHKLVPVSILGLSGAHTGNVTVTILGVTQDEPIRGTGSGDTGPDAVIQDSTVLLRAERAGNGNGRVYRITYQATSLGGSCTGFVYVRVPRDQGHCGGGGTDSGQIYNSVGP